MDHQDDKHRKQIDAERNRLLSLSPAEADKLAPADQYQRMRYEREIEANEYVRLLHRGMDRPKAAEAAREHADRIVSNWKVGNVP